MGARRDGLPDVLLDARHRQLLITGLDFVAIWMLFGTVDVLGGFSLAEIGLLYGATGIGIGVADLLVGRSSGSASAIRRARWTR